MKQLADLRKMVSPKNGGAPKVVYQPVVIGVKDVSSSQLLDAYKKGLTWNNSASLQTESTRQSRLSKNYRKWGVR